VFRCLRAGWPYEDAVDFLLVLEPSSPSGFQLVVATGYKAGHLLVSLPIEAKAPGNVHALAKSWLIQNWARWIYPKCPVEEVQVIERYPPLVSIDGVRAETSRDRKA
jgi:hypothetical protein